MELSEKINYEKNLVLANKQLIKIYTKKSKTALVKFGVDNINNQFIFGLVKTLKD